MRGFWSIAVLLCTPVVVEAQAALVEPPEFPLTQSGPRAVLSGEGCFYLASGTITPGDVDWVQVLIPRATTLTIVDVDFPANSGFSALLASVVGGTTEFNLSDNNGPRDAFCGLSGTTNPVGSTRDSAVSLGATARNSVVNIAVTGAEDSGFVGAHSRNFSYDVWVYTESVPCTSDSECNDGVACTVDHCDVATGVCSNDADDALCDNGRFCDGEEFCDAVRGCRSGPRPDCDDGVDCTIDDCDTVSDECVNLPDDSFCDNGTFCDGHERCDAVRDCRPGDPPDCDDGVRCTVDRCDADVDECVHEPDDALCDDGLFCNGMETCDAVRDCQAGTPPSCDDGVACTTDSCDRSVDDCVHTPDDGLCDNGVFCDGREVCDAVQGCVSGPDPCPGHACRESDQQCLGCRNDADCDDGDFCNGAETCGKKGVCRKGTPPCPKGLVCNPDARRCEGGAFALDIKPNACPNRLLPSDEQFLTMAILGAPGADVRKIKMSSIRLVRVDGVGGAVTPHEGPQGAHSSFDDLGTPFKGPACGCNARARDGQLDLALRFSIPELMRGLRLERTHAETPIELRIMGRLYDGTPFEATDCITVGGDGRHPDARR